jgi:hypothetical protein
MHTLGLGVCAQQRTRHRRLCCAARPFSAARALRAHQECGQRARAGVLPPGSSAEHTAQGCRAPRAQGQQTATAGQRMYWGRGAARQCARARAPRRRRRVGRPLAAPRPAARARAQLARKGAEQGARARQGRRTRPRGKARQRAKSSVVGKGTHTPVSRARAACGGQ